MITSNRNTIIAQWHPKTIILKPRKLMSEKKNQNDELAQPIAPITWGISRSSRIYKMLSELGVKLIWGGTLMERIVPDR